MHSTGCAATLAGSAQALDRWSGPADPIAFCHAVTALAAVRLVLPELLPDLARASVITCSATVGGIVATFAVPRRPDEAQAAAEGPAPDEVMARGIEDGDEHAITLAEAATRELARTADPTLLVAADRGPAAPAPNLRQRFVGCRLTQGRRLPHTPRFGRASLGSGHSGGWCGASRCRA